MNRLRLNINLLIVLTMALAGVSPFCKFVSGSIQFEICTAQGMQVVSLPGGADRADDPQTKGRGDCAYCFAASAVRLAPSAAGVVSAGGRFAVFVSFEKETPVLSYAPHDNFSARAPPFVL